MTAIIKAVVMTAPPSQCCTQHISSWKNEIKYFDANLHIWMMREMM